MSLGIASIWRIALQKAIITHNIHVSSYFSMRCHVLHRVSQEEKAFSGLTLASHRQSLNGGPKRSSPALAVERRRNWCGVRRTLSLSRTRYPTVGMLRVPPTKYAPARVLPLHPSAVEALRHYQTIRRKRFPFTRRFFVGPYGRPLSSSAAQRTFHHLVYDIPGNGARPRLRLSASARQHGGAHGREHREHHVLLDRNTMATNGESRRVVVWTTQYGSMSYLLT